MLVIYLCVFFLGASFASFLNATIYRIEKKFKYPDIIKTKSHCEKCKKDLTWWELIPIVGYIILKGKCKKCKNKIKLYYPLSETILGSVFLLFFFYNIIWYLWIIILFLFIFSSYDIKYKGIPKDLVHIFLIISTLLFFLFSFEITNIYFPIGFTMFLLLVNIIKKSFGLGDILVLLGLGILIDYRQYIVIFWGGIVIALLYSIMLIIKEKKDIRKTKIPMIPFFSLSFVISLIYGYQIHEILLKFLGMW
jgi:prepilin signal peptidase PulO-like enzyme (type II secretory pathway)